MLVLSIILVTTSSYSRAESAQFIMPPARTNVEQGDLNKYFAKQLIELETDQGKVLALFSPYMSAIKRGVVVMLPGADQGPLSPHGLGYLSQALTDDGFDTYAIQTPELNWQAGMFTPDDSAQGNTSEYQGPWSEAMLDEYKEHLLASFEALQQTLDLNSEQQFVVIAAGTSAGVFSEHLAALPDIEIDALITLSAQLPNIKRNKHLPAVLSLVGPPLLDIVYSQDNQTLLDNAQQRMRWVKRNNKYDYRQRELFGASNEPMQHQRLRKELNGFLRRL
ncbi:hypothetical protein BET10_07630 [Pseudoalteromonas amylolytica]|uniref:DUF3530 domain-containing protein n=1 Tax=Pseudoalteromonas amylolytica TaxID=1859457 RepID=A0A1S1MY03_9GAMM|nr:hypothetical protein BFC16_06525 [Pseudoalteromonas sp. JW3]OHU92260.1 hypothetical protein BET10_07630 [Pseudoalteromonas amylolytica]